MHTHTHTHTHTNIYMCGRDSSVGIAIATGWTVRVPNPGGRGEIFRTCPDRPWGPPNLLYNGYLFSFLEVKRSGHGVDQPPRLSPRLKKK
jgi:hypothetical protein